MHYVGTPVVTCPNAQTVPNLAAGMIRSMKLGEELERLLIVNSAAEYVNSVRVLMSVGVESFDQRVGGGEGESTSYPLPIRMRQKICDNAHLLYNDTQTVRDWETFLLRVAS